MAENNSGSDVLEWLQVQKLKDSAQLELLDVSWLIECMRAGRPVAATGKHQLVVSAVAVLVVGIAFCLLVMNMSFTISRPGLHLIACSRPVWSWAGGLASSAV